MKLTPHELSDSVVWSMVPLHKDRIFWTMYLRNLCEDGTLGLHLYV